jgi:hypothetical protein
VNAPVPPAAVGVRADGLTTKVHGAASVTVNVFVAIINVAVRAAPVAFAATLKLTVPFAEPLDPPVTVTQLPPPVVVHAQPDVVVTATVPVPPDQPNA